MILQKQLLDSANALNRKWWFDNPKQSLKLTDQISVRISGWVESYTGNKIDVIVKSADKNQYYPVNIKRPDVVQKLFTNVSSIDLTCGFDFEINIENLSDTFIVGFHVEGISYDVLSLNKRKVIKVQEGKNGWLFLDNDTNSSVDQFTGRKLLGEQHTTQYVKFFDELNTLSNELDFKWVYSIAPAKEFIFPDYYPHEISNYNILTQLKELEVGNILHHSENLIDNREFSYSKCDTHWTDYGALLIVKQILEYFGISSNALDSNALFKVKNVFGDLGSKLSPPVSCPVITSENKSENIIFCNGVINHGRIIVTENIDSFMDERVVVFGDSFSRVILQWLACVFRRVVWCYTAGSIDRSILENEEFDFLILQTNSRFLTIPPVSNYKIRDNIIVKLSRFSNDELSALKNEISSFRYVKGKDFFYRDMMYELLE